jgi:E3 ubiquitin-protein ligase HUWE1
MGGCIYQNPPLPFLHFHLPRPRTEKAASSSWQVELKEAGSKIPVTNANKHEYVELASMRRLVTGIQPQLDAFKAGFREVFPSELLEKFTEDELELVLCGLPAIDVQDWRANSLYRAGYTAESDVVVWFWEIVEGWDQAMRARLLQFVTGTSNVPTGGFGELYGANGPKLFQIIRVFDVTRLPQANTCFNELLLPPYASKEILAELLCMAILDGGVRANPLEETAHFHSLPASNHT